MTRQGIICPNCGAENKQMGTCDYCGSPIGECQDKVRIVKSSPNTEFSVNDNHILLQYQYDKFENNAIYVLKNRWNYLNALDLTFQYTICNDKTDIGVKLEHRGGWNLKYSTLYIQTDEIIREIKASYGKCGNYDYVRYIIDIETLNEICTSQSLSFKLKAKRELVFNDDGGIREIAQLFYNLFLDNTAYVSLMEDAIKQEEAAIKKRESEQLKKRNYVKEQKAIREKEAQLGGILLITFLIGLCYGVIGIFGGSECGLFVLIASCTTALLSFFCLLFDARKLCMIIQAVLIVLIISCFLADTGIIE